MKILKPILITLAATIFLFMFVTISMGGGHGTFMFAKIIYPYSMSMVLLENKINALPMILAVIQIPVYGIILYQKHKSRYLILGIHFIAILVCFYINGTVESYYN